MSTMSNGVYSVYRNNKWIYYQGIPGDIPATKSGLTGQYVAGAGNSATRVLIAQELGLTPEEACPTLPAMTIKVGEGVRPMGTIANGSSLLSTAGKCVIGFGVGSLLFYLLQPQSLQPQLEEELKEKRKAIL